MTFDKILQLVSLVLVCTHSVFSNIFSRIDLKICHVSSYFAVSRFLVIGLGLGLGLGVRIRV